MCQRTASGALQTVTFAAMEFEKEPAKKKFPKSFTVKHGLVEEYANKPPFQDQIERANRILEIAGIPDFDRLLKKDESPD